MNGSPDDLLAIQWDENNQALLLLDQRLLPNQILYRSYHSLEDIRDAISLMVVRGAPAIGVAAAYAVFLDAQGLPEEPSLFLNSLRQKTEYLSSARPTAVNLKWAVSRMMRRMEAEKSLPVPQIKQALLEEALKIHLEDESICRRIGESLLPKLYDGIGILTHCNAGQLATSRYGTALSPIYLASEKGMHVRVYADETRPRLQGSMLTAFELSAKNVDVTVICDNMAAVLMSRGAIDCCIVGCDRVAANGDTANKIGTLNAAILAKHFGIPFYVAAPTPTIDLCCTDGTMIPIEERDETEVSMRFGERTVPEGVKVFNPSFDITPHTLITAFATEHGLLYPPFTEGFRELIA